MSYTNFKQIIKEKLVTISGIQVVDYPTNDYSQYPYVCLNIDDGTGSWMTTLKSRREYGFEVKLYVSLSPELGDPSTNEGLFVSKLDEIISLFDQPASRHSTYHDMIKLSDVNISSVRKAGASVRVAEIKITCTKLNP